MDLGLCASHPDRHHTRSELAQGYHKAIHGVGTEFEHTSADSLVPTEQAEASSAEEAPSSTVASFEPAAVPKKQFEQVNDLSSPSPPCTSSIAFHGSPSSSCHALPSASSHLWSYRALVASEQAF